MTVKHLYTLYCESQHPDSWEEQDKLFEAICEQRVVVSPEDMQKAIADFQSNHDTENT